MKKYYLILLAILLHAIPTFSQIQTRYFPLGNAIDSIPFLRNIENKYVNDSLQKVTMPSFDVQKLISEDNDLQDCDTPFRFGKAFDTSYTLNDGIWNIVSGGRLWSMTFESLSAYSLNFIFNNFSLPEGAELYIVNKKSSVLYGPVTSELIPNSSSFLTDIIEGSCATIYLFEPDDHVNQSTLEIKRIVHGYRQVADVMNTHTKSSSSCNVDVACHAEYEKESKAIGLVILGDGLHCCSGSLLMTTNFLFKPYFLTAFHCVDYYDLNHTLSNNEIADLQNWMFKFNYKKDSCTGTTFSNGYTYNSATLKAAWYGSDFALLEIGQNLKNNTNISWLGWDNGGSSISKGVGIHHPAGDVMKISIDYNNPLDVVDFWNAYFDEGIVEGGSSGSPLLDQNKRVVGQLYFSNSASDPCDIIDAYYPKFSISWTGGGTNDTRLSNWLDPIGTNQTTIDGAYYADLQISAPTVPCIPQSYSINNLPSGYTVTWSYVNSNNSLSDALLLNNVPNQNQCTISAVAGDDRVEGILTATIKRNGQTVTTRSKLITNNHLITGTYSQIGYGIYPSIPETCIGPEVSVNPNCVVTLKSQDFVNHTITHTGANLSLWSIANDTTIYLKFPSNASGQSVTIIGRDVNSCSQFRFKVKATSNRLTNYSMKSKVSGNTLNISIQSKENVIDNGGNYTIEIIKSENGQIVYRGETNNRENDIDISSWKSGLYIIMYKIDDVSIVEKIALK